MRAFVRPSPFYKRRSPEPEVNNASGEGISLSKEIWKDIPGWEGYQVSDRGRVRSLSRQVICRTGESRHYRGKILRLYPVGKGYRMVGLCKGGNRSFPRVHRLVLKAFVGDSPLEGNHKDADKKNNHLSNLEYVTGVQNVQHALALGLRKPSYTWRGKFGKDHNRSIPVVQCDKEGNVLATFGSAREACRATGVCNRVIVKCRAGEQKTAGGYIWRDV